MKLGTATEAFSYFLSPDNDADAGMYYHDDADASMYYHDDADAGMYYHEDADAGMYVIL